MDKLYSDRMPPVLFSSPTRCVSLCSPWLVTTLEILIWGELSSFARSSTHLHRKRDVRWHGRKGGKREVAKLFTKTIPNSFSLPSLILSPNERKRRQSASVGWACGSNTISTLRLSLTWFRSENQAFCFELFISKLYTRMYETRLGS